MWFNGMGVLEAFEYESKAKEILLQAIESAKRDYDEYAEAYVNRLQEVLRMMENGVKTSV